MILVQWNWIIWCYAPKGQKKSICPVTVKRWFLHSVELLYWLNAFRTVIIVVEYIINWPPSTTREQQRAFQEDPLFLGIIITHLVFGTLTILVWFKILFLWICHCPNKWGFKQVIHKFILRNNITREWFTFVILGVVEVCYLREWEKPDGKFEGLNLKFYFVFDLGIG